MNRYEWKQEQRRERLEARADRLRSEANASYKSGMDRLKAIPFGQPILVGHYSEKSDRSYRRKAVGAVDKSFRLQKEADKVASRAESVGTGGISSDDPDAVTKLKEKLAKLEELQAKMTAGNKLVRKKDVAGLAAMFGAKIAGELMSPDCCGRLGFPSYRLSNNNAEIRRVKLRIAQLERNATRETKEAELPGGVRMVENAEENRLQLFFPGKPDAEVRTKLKKSGFRWAPSEGAWQRQLSTNAKWAAGYVLGVEVK